MKILERAALVSLYGIILPDDIHIVVVDVHLLVAIAILKVVARR